MLRCTFASLIPLLNSEIYSSHRKILYEKHRKLFQNIITHESYYLLREIPPEIVSQFLPEHIPTILDQQNKRGTWKIKDGERITYDILSALNHIGKLPDVRNELKYDLLSYLKNKGDIYSLLIKRDFFDILTPEDEQRLEGIVLSIIKDQSDNGSWYNTVIGSVLQLYTLLMCGLEKDHESIAKGIAYLFNNLNESVAGFRKDSPYGLMAHHMFSSADRMEEYKIASMLKPEWIPRQVCYTHLAVIQNAMALNLMIKLGNEKDARIQSALTNLFEIEHQWGGFCVSDIMKGYIQNNRSKRSES